MKNKLAKINKISENKEMKVGDIVLCVDDRDSRSLRYHSEYQVVDVNRHGNLRVAKRCDIGSDFLAPLEHYYKPSRFTLVEENNTLDWSKPLWTRDGQDARLVGNLKYGGGGPEFTHCVETEDGQFYFVTRNGEVWLDQEDDGDILNTPNIQYYDGGKIMVKGRKIFVSGIEISREELAKALVE